MAGRYYSFSGAAVALSATDLPDHFAVFLLPTLPGLAGCALLTQTGSALITPRAAVARCASMGTA